jgi:pimeloyl-ACP methyl ester carboxylesterase
VPFRPGSPKGRFAPKADIRASFEPLELSFYCSVRRDELVKSWDGPMKRFLTLAALLAVLDSSAEAQTTTPHDKSPHKVQFVTVDKVIKLEVLDWGGSGKPLIFLAGLGATAHDFDKFALRFTSKHHVYGITRRGFGASDKPKPTVSNYSADRLGNDVIAVMDALRIVRPVLAGHSIAGSELSSVGSRYPGKISGLVYLDAAYVYAFYNPDIMPLYLNLTVNDIHARVNKLSQRGAPSALVKAEIDQLFETNLQQLEIDLRLTRRFLGSADTPDNRLVDPASAILAGVRKYGSGNVPVLAIYALPKAIPQKATAAERADRAAHDAIDGKTADLFALGNPKAKVVRIANSEHDVFNSNPIAVEREMNTFMDGLPL